MFNATQLLLFTSTIIEYSKLKDAKRPMSSLELFVALGKASSYSKVIIPDGSIGMSVTGNPIALFGKLSEILKDASVTTWTGDELNETSLTGVLDAIMKVDLNESSGDAVKEGTDIVDALPPLVKSLVSNVISAVEDFDGQQPLDVLDGRTNHPANTDIAKVSEESKYLNQNLFNIPE